MLCTLLPSTFSFVVQSRTSYLSCTQWKSTGNENNEENVTRTSFGQAEASLIEEEDRKRLQEMGDFDANPAVRCVRFV